MMTETRPHLAQTPTSACRCVSLALRMMTVMPPPTALRASLAHTLQVVSSHSPDVRPVPLGSQMTTLMRRQRVLSAWLASTQRRGTAVSALAAQVVASHQRLAE